MSYVIKYKGKYARFGSYSKMTLVDRPENATVYARLKDAERRLAGRNLYCNNKPIANTDCGIYEVTFSFTECPVV